MNQTRAAKKQDLVIPMSFRRIFSIFRRRSSNENKEMATANEMAGATYIDYRNDMDKENKAMFRRSAISFFFGLLVWVSTCAAQMAAPTPQNLGSFDEIVTKAMAEWKVPGLAVAVVRDGKVIYAKGFGYRDVEKKLPVTTDTLFAIGSVSKSFTSLVFATLNDEGKVDWDTPVRTYLPTFQLFDPIATDHATPRDMFSHRTGLPRHDFVWYSSNFGMEDLFHRLRYLKPNKEFRAGYEYNNLTIMTMGYLEGKVANSTWQDLVRTRIFQPLGMQRSDLSVDDMQKSSDFSQPYSVKDDVVTKVPFKNIDGIAPAGSINSSINEMSHYMILHLGDGTYEGKRIVSEKNLRTDAHWPDRNASPRRASSWRVSGQRSMPWDGWRPRSADITWYGTTAALTGFTPS